ncbi:ATP-dependent helicase [Emcibacteraceae bacterium]|nr:ATP-dependent helicase [Emcibacteraceae bacterium]
MELNAEQKIAAEYMDGPALVLAGPGTGKTTTLVARYKHLLVNNVPAQKILSCTFSKKAADEMKFRLGEATDIQTKSPPIGTFHSLSLKILKSIGEPIGVGKDFVIWAKDWEREKVVDGYLKELIKAGVYDEVDKDEINARSALNFIDDSRETLLDPEDASVKASEKGDVAGIAHAELYSLYNNYLNTENKIDFPRMVELACKALEQNNDDGGKFGEKFTHILVDEYQDINLAQKTLIDLILAEGTQLWAVGDDFQAIYGWRGSDIRYILEFSKQYSGAKVFTLPQNYRSGKLIIDAANRVSANIKEKFDKDLKATRSVEGEIIYDHLANEDNEAEAIVNEIEERIRLGIPKSEIAVLARTNKLPINTVNLLIRRGIPLNLKGGVAAFTEYEARLLLTAIASSSEQKLENIWALRMSPGLYGFSKKLIGENWERRVKALATYIQKRPPQGISDEEIKAQEENLERYRDYILTFKDASSLFGILKSVLDNNENTDRVFVGTIHSAKGLEWDTVIIMGWEDGMLPQRQSISHRAFEEERRIAYVGITRAKNLLMLTYVKERNGQENIISPFIDEIFIDEASQDIIASDQTPLNDGNLNNSHDQFSGTYTSKNSDDDKLENFLQYLRKIREDVKRRSIKKIADGQGDGSGWSDQSAGTGFLAEVGYTVKKDGPLSDERQSILSDVLHGQLDLPDWISESVQDQWGEPNTEERFSKIRNTINVALGQQKGRLEPSSQAIEKWEDDLTFLDEELLPQVVRDK